MSNYSKENLIAIPKNQVSPGDLAVKIGGEIFVCGKSMQFYKCASVDTESKTWTGYRAFMEDGGYSFETELTEGLFCDEGYTPVVGNIYSADALISVRGLWLNGIPDDPVFFAPLASDVSYAETGQALTIHGNVTFKSAEAVPCAVFSGNSSDYISFDDTGMPDGSSSRTISLFVKRTASVDDATLFNYGREAAGTRFGLFMHDSKIVCGIGGTNVDLSYNFQINTWYCLTALLDKNTVTLYVNGENIVTNSLSTTPNTVLDSVGYLCHRNGNPFTGEIANLRVYDRLLTPTEIRSLANEFTQTV